LAATDETGGTRPIGGEHSPNMANAIGEAVRSLAEEEEKTLTFYAFPVTMHRHIQSTNAIESLFSNVRQRTDQIDVFTTEDSCLTIVWATIQDIRLHKIAM
jgi:putative transposase